MPALQSYFDDFLAKVRLQQDLRVALQEAHEDLTLRLKADVQLTPIVVDTFLQGSYKRATILEPDPGEAADVDLVVVTRLDERQHPEPATAMKLFEPFLEANYPGRWKPQDRSFGIKEGRIKLDMVITSAPSEAIRKMIESKAVRSSLTLDDDPEFRIRKAWVEPQGRQLKTTWVEAMLREASAHAMWRDEPLRIPDRKLKCWEPTHPLAQIDWTAEKNAACNGHYLGVVRTLKWWRHLNPTPKYPKGYPVEHLVGDSCPDGILSTAEGVVLTLETLHEKWKGMLLGPTSPYLCDHGVDRNVLARVSLADFAAFHALVGPAAKLARQAFESEDKHTGVQLWQKLLGSRFPDPPEWSRPGHAVGGFSPRKAQGLVGGGRFA